MYVYFKSQLPNLCFTGFYKHPFSIKKNGYI